MTKWHNLVNTFYIKNYTEALMTTLTNKLITIHFTIKGEKGNLIDSTVGQEPYSFLSDSQQMFPKVEEKIGEMKVGDKLELTLSPEDAYGEHNEEAVQVTARAGFPGDAELKEGMTFLTKQGEQEVPVTIKKIEDENVTIDFNHPMAGQKVICELELISTRDATEDDKAAQHDHGDACSCSH